MELPCFCKSSAVISLRMRVKSCAAAKAADCAARNSSCKRFKSFSTWFSANCFFSSASRCSASAASDADSFSGHGRQFLLRGAAAFLGLRDVRQRLGILRRQFAQTLLVELNPALVPVRFALQFQPALLHRGDFVLQFRKPFAQLLDFILATQHVGGTGFNFAAQFFRGGIFLRNLGVQHVELMPRKLRVEMLQFVRNLFVAARLAGLPLERADLPLHFADQVRDAQKILLGVFEFAERFLFLAFDIS